MQQSLKSLFFQHMAQTTLEPIALRIDRAEGVYIYDENGIPYFDLISGISVSNLGHQNPKIIEAIKNQVDKHLHIMVYGEVIHHTPTKLSELLCENLPEPLKNVYLVNSGNEATDVAMKLAKRVTGRTDFVAHYQAYHGSGQGPLSLMSDPYFTQRYRPLLNQVHYIQQNNIEAIKQLPEHGVAAVIVELIQAERGAISSDIDYIRSLREYCNKTNSLLIFDEIQTGLFRTGTFMAFEHFDVLPDILLLGKSFGGGMPMAAVISSKKHMQHFAQNPILGHITTFGGHPVSAAAALANLEELLRLKNQLQVVEKGTYFKNKLVHPLIKKVSGEGLLLACHLNAAVNIIQFNKKLLANGVFTDWFLFNMNAIRIAPPLIITLEEIDQICEIILFCLDDFEENIGG